MAMMATVRNAVGILRSWDLLIDLSSLSQLDGTSEKGGIYARETQVCDNSWLIECKTRRSDGEEGPAESEEPHPNILKGQDNLAETKVRLRFSGCVAGESSLDESFLLFCKPFRSGWD